MKDTTQYIFFLGKGGVGKSTLAALTALKLSIDNSVLLTSMDPAHNLSDIFLEKFSEKPSALNKNLLVKEIDTEKWIKKYLKDIEEQMQKTYTYFTAFNLEKYFGLIKYSPGIEEYILITAFKKISEQFSDKKYIIFDMPPTALALKFFSLSSLSLLWLEQLMNLRKEIIKRHDMITKVKLGKKEYEFDKVLNKLSHQIKFYTELQQVFKNHSKTKIDLVLNPDDISIAESKRIVEKLKKLGIGTSSIYLNKIDKDEEYKIDSNFFKKSQLIEIPYSDKPLIGIETLKEFIPNLKLSDQETK